MSFFMPWCDFLSLKRFHPRAFTAALRRLISFECIPQINPPAFKALDKISFLAACFRFDLLFLCAALKKHLYQLMPLKSFSMNPLPNWKIHSPSGHMWAHEAHQKIRFRLTPPSLFDFWHFKRLPSPPHRIINQLNRWFLLQLAFLCVYSPTQIRSKQIKTFEEEKKKNYEKPKKKVSRARSELLAEMA